MKKSTVRTRLVVGAIILIQYWLVAIAAIRKGTIFAYQNYFGAPQEKYTLVFILIIGTAVYFIYAWQHFWKKPGIKEINPDKIIWKSVSQRLYEARTARELAKAKDAAADPNRAKPIRHRINLP